MPRSIKAEERPLNAQIGKRLRLRRKYLRLSQAQVAVHLGISYQQYQKYGKGEGRISAARLYRLCFVLEVPLDHFFEDIAPGAPITAEEAKLLHLFRTMSGEGQRRLLSIAPMLEASSY